MDHIFIEGLRAQANVGIFPHEKGVSQTIEIDLCIGLPDLAGRRDDIADTIAYDRVVERIRAVLQENRFNLLETLGEFVVSLLFEEFGSPWVRLSVAKPGILPEVGRIGISLERTRGVGK